MRLLVPSIALSVLAAGAVVAAEPTPRAQLDLAAEPLFTAKNLLPGERRVACTTLRNTGDAAGRAALFAGARRGELAQHLHLEVTRGCSGGAVVFRGTLADFPSTVDDALIDDAWRPGESRDYRFELELADNPAAAGKSVSWDWHVAAETLAPATAAARSSSCERVQLVGRRRTLTRTVRINRRVRAVLILRSSSADSAPRVTATTGLRVRGNKTLLIPSWARVRYRLNGRASGAPRRRPFRTTLNASAFKSGTNRIAITVQPRRGRKRTTTFRLNVNATKDSCVVTA